MFGFDKPKVLEEVESKFSGTLRVTDGYGERYVTTGIWTQSGGVIKEIWQPVLKKIAKKDKSWLVLGLATGTVAQLINKKYHPTRIMGIEIDPEMIRIGWQYFDLAKIPKLEIGNVSAEDYVSVATEKFDYVLVDVYLEDKLPGFVYSDQFLSKKIGETIVFNHLFHTSEQKQNAEKLIAKLREKYPKIELVRVLTNVMIICA